MALPMLQLIVWLFSICALAQPQPPGPVRNLPRPLFTLKLTADRQIMTSERMQQTFSALYALQGNSASEPSTVSNLAVVSANGTILPPYDTVYTFDQLIDHNNTALGTFQQRYYFTYEFYDPGGPIFFSVPSESILENFDGSVTNSSITGYLAQQNRGAAVVLEHRFFGESNPYPDLTEDSLALLTVEQGIADIVYFAQNVQLPMPNGTRVGPYQAPWVLIGGSYPGSLVTWAMSGHTDLFAAGWASSAVLQSQAYFWSYFDIINQFMPANCSADLRNVITTLDQTFTTGTPSQQLLAKQGFGLSNVVYADDVMAAIRTPLFTWQDLQPYYQDPNAGIYAFCNYLEYDRTKKQYETTGNGVGLQTALSAYGNWTQYEIKVAGCTGYEEECYGTHSLNSSLVTWTNTTVGNSARSWAWLYCNQMGWFFSGAPPNWPTITSRLTTPDSEVRICSLYFPSRFPMGVNATQVHNETAFNNRYGGWNINTTNIFFSNGKKDVWRGVTLSSDLQNHVGATWQPIAVADGGFHCSDLVIQAGQSDPTVGAVQNLGAAYIYSWLGEWYDAHPNVTRPVNATSLPDPLSLSTPTISVESIPPTIIAASPTFITTSLSAVYPTITISSSAAPTAIPSPQSANFDNTGATKSSATRLSTAPVLFGVVVMVFSWTFGW